MVKMTISLVHIGMLKETIRKILFSRRNKAITICEYQIITKRYTA